MDKLRELQREIYRNKLDKGFNVTDICREFCYLQSELTEAFDAWNRGRDTVGEELADVAIYLLGLAEILDIDLGAEIVRKMDINRRRRYVPHGGMGWIKVEEPPDTSEN